MINSTRYVTLIALRYSLRDPATTLTLLLNPHVRCAASVNYCIQWRQRFFPFWYLTFKCSSGELGWVCKPGTSYITTLACFKGPQKCMQAKDKGKSDRFESATKSSKAVQLHSGLCRPWTSYCFSTLDWNSEITDDTREDSNMNYLKYELLGMRSSITRTRSSIENSLPNSRSTWRKRTMLFLVRFVNPLSFSILFLPSEAGFMNGFCPELCG